MAAPRANVYSAWSGDFVCQSLMGQPFEIDPATWGCECPPDEVERLMWLAARHPTKT